jgi:phosphohistidine phosphatase
MKNIIIIRHAKSSWEFQLKDIDRPILKKGIEKSYKVAEASRLFFKENSIIFISNAKRTQQTAKIFLKFITTEEKNIFIKNDLYTFSLSEFEEIVKCCPNEHKNLILFGHNGAITDFVNKFGDVYIDNVPTSGFISITFETDDWKSIKKGKTDKIIFPSLI